MSPLLLAATLALCPRAQLQAAAIELPRQGALPGPDSASLPQTLRAPAFGEPLSPFGALLPLAPLKMPGLLGPGPARADLAAAPLASALPASAQIVSGLRPPPLLEAGGLARDREAAPREPLRQGLLRMEGAAKEALAPEASAEGSARSAGADFDGLLKLALGAEIPGSIQSSLDAQAGVIDGLPARRLKTLGADNRGIFALEREGSRRILKVLDYAERGIMHGPQGAREQLRGALLGELFGAPRVRRSGLIRGVEDENLFFIEMDELFPGEDGVSLKALYDSRVNDRSRFTRERPDGGRATRDIARMLVSAFERGIVPRDADFYATGSGKVAWIDTPQWHRPERFSDRESLREAALQLREISRRLAVDPEAGRAFLEDLLPVLKSSGRLSEADKRELLRGAFHRHPDWDAILSRYDSLP